MKIYRYCFTTLCLLIALGVSVVKVHALESSDLLFHLSFENEVMPELARGSSAPAVLPQQLAERLTDGLFGKGYRFSGVGSTIEYYTGDRGGRAVDEMYSPNSANFFGDSGTVSFWLHPLPNVGDRQHLFFRCNDAQAFQIQLSQYGMSTIYPNRESYFFDGPLAGLPWIHIAVTYQKGRSQTYMNGRLMIDLIGDGVLSPTPERFQIASESVLNGPRQLEAVDDMVMDEFQIFRRPLAPEEIRSLFERGHSTVQMPTAAYRQYDAAPQRAFAPSVMTAPQIKTPIAIDGNLSDWKFVPAQGGFVERRIGVLDDDDGQIYTTVDEKNLYLAFRTEVDRELQADPTHVKYPLGQYKAASNKRDADVYQDDYVEYSLKSKDGHLYRFALNAKGAFLDSRDGDNKWNSNGKAVSRSNFQDWTVEVAIPLKELGLAVGDNVDFKVVRSWKLFKSSQNSLCIDAQAQPAFGKLGLGTGAVASLSSLFLGQANDLIVKGMIDGPTGEYTIRVHGKGSNAEFTEESKVQAVKEPLAFQVKRKLETAGDLGIVTEVLDPAGRIVLTRTLPIVFTKKLSVELANYPGWGKLDVGVSPLQSEGVHAHVELLSVHNAAPLTAHEITSFESPTQTVRFDTAGLAPGPYEILTRVWKGDELVGDDRQSYVKKPLPDWFDSKAGLITKPPIPWTDMQVQTIGTETTISCLLKKVTFDKSIFPTKIISNGQPLLAAPARLRIKSNGKEEIISTGEFKITSHTPRAVSWVSTAKAGKTVVTVNGRIEFDGFTWMKLSLSGERVEHLALEIPLHPKTAMLKSLEGTGAIGKLPLEMPDTFGNYWFGNERAGFQFTGQSYKGWVRDGQQGKVTPSPEAVLISLPFIQKTFQLDKPRTIEFGWCITPSKPVRKDWRALSLYRGTRVYDGDYTWVSGNYPQPRDPKTVYDRMRSELQKGDQPITAWYAFGPYQWIGSPEYADWWREWRFTPSGQVKPDANSTIWSGPACFNSSSANLYASRLEGFVKHYPQRAIYVDVMDGDLCDNPAHNCGYIDDDGVRRPEYALLAERRHYERMHNIIKASDPKDGWLRFHDWRPIMARSAFCDENWIGEAWIGALAKSSGKNYYDIVDLPACRYYFGKEQWGHLTSWLTEMGTAGDDSRAWRESVFGKMISPPKDGRRGQWILPKWKDYEHVAGLGLIHDMHQIGGNDLQLPWLVVQEMQRRLGFDDSVRFIGYWQLGDALRVEGGVSEKVVCSVFFKRGQVQASGKTSSPVYLLAPMNNTDEDITLILKPNLTKFGLQALANGRFLDMYRALPWTFAPSHWKANADDPESPYIVGQPTEEYFDLKEGVAKVTIPKRSFRALLLLEKNAKPNLKAPSDRLPFLLND